MQAQHFTNSFVSSKRNSVRIARKYERTRVEVHTCFDDLDRQPIAYVNYSSPITIRRALCENINTQIRHPEIGEI